MKQISLAKHVFPPTLAALTALGLAPLTAHAQTVYIGGNGGEFGTLNIATGQFTSIATLSNIVSGLGFTSDGNLYGMSSSSEVYRIDPATGAEIELGNTASSHFMGGTASGSLVYGINNASSATFFSVDPSASPLSSGVTQINTDTGIYASGLLAADGNTLYATSFDLGNPGALYRLSTSGTVTTIGPTGAATNFDSGVFTEGALFGFGTDNNSYALNTVTGAATLIHSFDIGDGDRIYAAAAAPLAAAPEPSSVCALIVGILSLGCLTIRVRRRRTV